MERACCMANRERCKSLYLNGDQDLIREIKIDRRCDGLMMMMLRKILKIKFSLDDGAHTQSLQMINVWAAIINNNNIRWHTGLAGHL